MRYKHKPISRLSYRGKLIKELDDMFSEILKLERGPNCEIHNKICDRVGNMHLLSKQAHPRLRYRRENIIRCGWFCGHYYSHHAFDDKRAEYVRERIIAIKGKDWKEAAGKAAAKMAEELQSA